MGEWTEVASANRGVRGGFSEEVEDEESVESERVGVRLRAAGRRFSSYERVLVGFPEGLGCFSHCLPCGAMVKDV